MRKILNITLWIAFIAATVVVLGFVQARQVRGKAKKLEIVVNASDDNYFVTRDDIRQMLLDKGDSIINQPVASINVPDLEKLIRNNPSVAKADVFISVSGQMNITVDQRKPVARIFTLNDETYYIDEEGNLMPWSGTYSADVVTVNGFVNESYGNWYRYSMKDIEALAPLKEYSVLDDIYRIAGFINENTWRKSFIGQIYVNASKEFELLPRLGTFRIILGDSGDLEEKFRKLMIFCREGLRNTGAWNEYSVVNLKYKNQIVCTKRF